MTNMVHGAFSADDAKIAARCLLKILEHPNELKEFLADPEKYTKQELGHKLTDDQIKEVEKLRCDLQLFNPKSAEGEAAGGITLD